jgi:hypothetical protein
VRPRCPEVASWQPARRSQSEVRLLLPPRLPSPLVLFGPVSSLTTLHRTDFHLLIIRLAGQPGHPPSIPRSSVRWVSPPCDGYDLHAGTSQFYSHFCSELRVAGEEGINTPVLSLLLAFLRYESTTSRSFRPLCVSRMRGTVLLCAACASLFHFPVDHRPVTLGRILLSLCVTRYAFHVRIRFSPV